MTSPAVPVRVLLIGMMGAGKTTVGHAISDLTGWPYVDNDELVAAVAGTETSALGERGAEALHAVEREVVARILDLEPPVVAGIPGSAVTDETTRAHLRERGTVVWLRARVETLAARVGDGHDRPFFAGRDVTEVLRELYVGRGPAYDAAAHLVVDVDDRTPREIAAWIVDNLGAPAARPGAH